MILIHLYYNLMNKHNSNIADQYDIISESFDNSRIRIWNNVKIFLNNDNNNDNKYLLDCGCGNGKNMVYAKTLGYKCKGFDISNNLINLFKKKNLDVYYADILDNKNDFKYDKILAIAILHHLENEQLQKIAILNMLNKLNNNGKLLLSFWSQEKNYDNSKLKKNILDYREFKTGVNYVKWKLDKNNIIERFYYIHNYNTIINLANSIGYRYEINWELQNWFILFYKK